MWLRWLVSSFVAQTARQQVTETVRNAVRTQLHEALQSAGSRAEPADGDIEPCSVAVIFALGIEAGGFVDLLGDKTQAKTASYLEHVGTLHGKRLVLAESGVGQAAAAQATADVLRYFRPTWVVSAGFAGSLHKEIRRGHFLMADVVANTEGNELAVGLKLPPNVIQTTPGLHTGRLLTVDRLIRTSEERHQLAKQHDAVACDMESFAVAEICRQQRTRFLSVRIISDGVDDVLPKEVENLLEQKSLAGKLGAAAGAMLNRPSSVKDLWKLREDALLASDRLAKFLTGVIEQLSATQPPDSQHLR